MLKHLTIKNYALIKHLQFDPSRSLNVITGETGAGKSIMLGALGLLMGHRADTKVLWDDQEKCVTEGVFDIAKYQLRTFFKNEDLDYDDNTVIRREINPTGKSRAFINDTPVTLEVLKRIGSLLMDIHSQHETLQLSSHNFQLKLVDAYADNQILREQYHALWTGYQQAKKTYDALVAEAETLRQEADFVGFQLAELKKAQLEPNEQENLEAELKIMDHAEEIKSKFLQSISLLTESEFSSRNSLSEVRSHLQQISSYGTVYDSIFNRIESVIIELDDIINEIEKAERQIDFDEDRAEYVRERISSIYGLLKKHRVKDVNELLLIQERLEQKYQISSNVDEALATAKQNFESADTKVRAAAQRLSESRAKAFKPLCNQIVALLHELGMPQASINIDAEKTASSPSGIDKIEILFSANKGMPLRSIAQVASGGEFSRLMFSIKYVMTEKTAMPTLILDEIDTGISGEVAIKLGNMMKMMSKKHQIISISHLPQIAAKADAHYFVFKDNSSIKTISSLKRLTDEQRVEEIAKMIGGAKPSKIALENAQELLST